MNIDSVNISLLRRHVDADFCIILHIHSRQVSGAAIYCILYIFMKRLHGSGGANLQQTAEGLLLGLL